MIKAKNIVAFALMLIALSMAALTAANTASTVYADYSLNSLYTQSTSSELTISTDKKAVCKSEAYGFPGTTTKIIMNQTLQKKKSSGSWGIVQAWSSTVNGSQAKVTKKSDSSLSAGTYRLKTVFIVYSGAKSETITKYSSTKTVK